MDERSAAPTACMTAMSGFMVNSPLPWDRQRQRGFLRLGPRRGIAVAPYRTRPGGIALAAADHMDVQLSDHVTEIADIELLDAWQGADDVRQLHDLFHQLRLVGLAEIAHFHRARAARHQQTPLVAGVVVEKETAERPIRKLAGQRNNHGVHGEIGHASLLSKSAGIESGNDLALPEN